MNINCLEVNGDVLNVTLPDNQEGHILVSIFATQLDVLIANNQLPQTKVLKVNGSITLLLSYLITGKVIDFYEAIAFYVPYDINGYVVSVSKSDDYPVGSRIDAQTGNESNPQEPPFLINWSSDILMAEINNRVKVGGDMMVREAFEQLKKLHLPEEKGGLVKINGRCPVLVGSTIAAYLSQFYDAIAVCDPKLGTSDQDCYVVVVTKDREYPLGTTIKIDKPVEKRCKIVLCGPKNTGKTCLREGLKDNLHRLPDAPRSYVISGCPDGDGAWFHQTAQHDSDLARSLKDQWKRDFTPEFAEAKANQIKAIGVPILVFDVGGKISAENRIIMSKATHSIILVQSEDQIQEWQDFCDELKLPVIAIIISDYKGKEDTLISNSSPLRGRVHYLDRSVNVADRPTIKALAELLTHLCNNP
ncbi:CRISPR-associated protein Csx3 [Gloeocapsa sp. PCC 73106]|uniref:CRISPR-associated protein Csx3 n=1 Tax=Gloeocapsa sp. PCC 73106 TaxID=102232 RepID=UPI0002AC8B47|nr:CRISPR-associated protein Csx3 [Gloeocapsa sp. PCC 73106]ELR98431.1 CRISPR-associated protein [Gloeocapsa sp. PCC 73106]